MPKQLYPDPAVESIWLMKVMEQRYSWESELMQAVSQGLNRKVEVLMDRFSQIFLEQRTSEPLRDMKNYCIVLNTLLRKAAEQGGVHPLYLHELSNKYANQIETVTTVAIIRPLMEEMIYAYCELVQDHSTRQYSALVQQVILHISTNLSGDLSLKSLADMQNISASYLSTRFKKETGQTVTDYINEKRMRLATSLLWNTNLQIQTIAQHCGMVDVNYFSKMFKKYIGKSPMEYRKYLKSQHIT